jgi:hypothetical protein
MWLLRETKMSISHPDIFEFRARELALIAGLNPDALTEATQLPAWYSFRDAAEAEHELHTSAIKNGIATSTVQGHT